LLSGQATDGGAAKYHAVPEAWDMLMHDLEQAPPRYVLDTSAGGNYSDFRFPPEQYERLWSFLTQRYTVDTTLAGVRVFVRR
jgi:hypothetical protein